MKKYHVDVCRKCNPKNPLPVKWCSYENWLARYRIWDGFNMSKITTLNSDVSPGDSCSHPDILKIKHNIVFLYKLVKVQATSYLLHLQIKSGFMYKTAIEDQPMMHINPHSRSNKSYTLTGVLKHILGTIQLATLNWTTVQNLTWWDPISHPSLCSHSRWMSNQRKRGKTFSKWIPVHHFTRTVFLAKITWFKCFTLISLTNLQTMRVLCLKDGFKRTESRWPDK